MEEKIEKKKIVKQRKITSSRLKNIALYYLERFETSKSNLRNVLRRRVDKYAFENKEYDKSESYVWIDEIISEFNRLGYVNDERYANLQIERHIRAGKSLLYIQGKLREKGIAEDLIKSLLEESEYDPREAAQTFARKKKIGPYRSSLEEREEYKQKDMGSMARAGFSYDVIIKILDIDEEF